MDGSDHSLTLEPLRPHLGVEICGLDPKAISPEQRDAVLDALDAHGCLLVRGQAFTPAELIDFARTLRPPFVPPPEMAAKTSAEFPELYVVSNIRDAAGKKIGGLGAGEAMWHADLSYLDNPPEASLLYAVEVPPEGGDTSVCSLAAALETMPTDLRARIAGRRIKHDGLYTAGGDLRVGAELGTSPAESEGTFHPALCVHPRTGREFLFLGRRINAYVEGLPLAESEALLDDLWAHVTRPEHVYRHRWRVGDLLMWDNRTTLHRRDAFDPASRRHMHHVRLQGCGAPVPATA